MRVTTRLEPATLAHVDALLAGDDVFAARFHRPVAPGYLDFPEALPMTRHALTNGTPPEWHSHLIVDAVTDTVVGFGGYKGPPDGGEVEIELFVAKARAGGATVVVANTLPGPNPSTAVLQRCGFVHTDDFMDGEVGGVWRWERRLE
jgi:ribosomal-protein-alanine N-acetyltransferase